MRHRKNLNSFPIFIVMLGFLFLFIDDCNPLPRFLEKAGTMKKEAKTYDALGSILLDTASMRLQQLKQQQQHEQQQQQRSELFSGFHEDISNNERHMTRVKRSVQTCIANVTINKEKDRQPFMILEMTCKRQTGCTPIKRTQKVIKYLGKYREEDVYMIDTYTYIANCILSS
ncbi:uncharacterized protein LOC116295840 isoform X1 [Actinia tenebrosa]|uniref:Uncharacterized protein LOC116295840 isoform X1 n=1 Tax=Actinia tenebrosa TaxID=6105 RepID=A0A6P8HWA7_ACTTE|nr:uncharacterized protein LOC116295840 isoform X1 [Actinia tenebrosa]